MSVSFTSNCWNRIRYTLWAPFYDVIELFFRQKRKRALALASPQPGESVLLVGAGTGLDLPYIPTGCAVTAVDLTPAMLERLRGRARQLGLAAEVRVMDAHQLEFPDASFDLVVLHLILAVIPDPVRCIQEATRVLKASGRILVFDKFLPDGAHPTPVQRALQPIASLIGTELNRQLGPLLHCAGLQKVHDEPAGLGGFFRIALARKPSS